MSNPNPPANKGFVISNTNVISGNLTSTATISAAGTWSSVGASSSRPAVPPPPPANWTTVKIRGNAFSEDQEVHEPPITGRMTWVASLCVSNPNGMHHWKLFERLNPDIEFVFCSVPTDPKASYSSAFTNVVFFNENDSSVFEQWFADYCETFGGKENIYSFRLPPPPRVMGYSVQVMMASHDLAELSEWIMNNCHDKVYFLGEMLFFLNDEDATLYKMRFSGT